MTEETRVMRVCPRCGIYVVEAPCPACPVLRDARPHEVLADVLSDVLVFAGHWLNRLTARSGRRHLRVRSDS